MKRLSTILLIIMAVLFACTLVQSGPVNAIVKLKWTAPGDDGHTGQADHYVIRFTEDSTKAFDSWTLIPQTMMPAQALQPDSITVTVLAPETEMNYHFALVTYDEAGNRSLNVSNIASIYITDQYPPGDVTDIVATLISVSQP